MNWPSLSAECTHEIAEILEEAVRLKPKDLFEHVAARLQERSGLDPSDFEAQFLECKRKPRTYALEDVCPADQDPLVWVPMRYNDETIYQSLRTHSAEIVGDILSKSPLEGFAKVTEAAKAAFPELAYIRGTAEEITANQVLRVVYLGASASPDVLDEAEDSEDPMLVFRCSGLLENLRTLFKPLTHRQQLVEAVLVAGLLRVVGMGAAFRERYGGGATLPEPAVLNAIDNDPDALPSFQRLSAESQDLVIAVLQAWFPLDQLVLAEAVPAHLAKAKDTLLSLELGIAIFHCAIAMDHAVRCRSATSSGQIADLARLAGQAIVNCDKYAAPRAYEMYLKRRAERRQWWLAREDHLQKATIRLACALGFEDPDAWSATMEAVGELSEREKEALKTELGRKDGLAESPAYVLEGCGAFLAQAYANERVTLESAVKLLARILEDAGQTFDKTLKHKVIRVCMDGLSARARAHDEGDVSFQDLAFSLEEVAPGEVHVRVAGG